MTDRKEPTVQLCLNDDEVNALKDLLQFGRHVMSSNLQYILDDIETGNFITLDQDE